MTKITFVNGTTPAINDTNLNQMQTNIENAIEQTKIKYIIVTQSSKQNLSSSTQISLNVVYKNIGNKFSLSNNAVVVGTNVARVRISGAIFVEAPQGTGYVWGQIRKNDINISTAITPYNNGGGFLSSVIPPIIEEVSQGDVIKLIGDSTVQGNTRNGVANTWLLVEALEY